MLATEACFKMELVFKQTHFSCADELIRVRALPTVDMDKRCLASRPVRKMTTIR